MATEPPNFAWPKTWPLAENYANPKTCFFHVLYFSSRPGCP
ncbi:protein ECHIDNA-like protein [Corchorus olitorius]|uniref:Protein ECHIDNA-like protein n=1 Tax=Corchorus olitorius TaxID=93759 RepID=A0A1R3KER8_9ROSI|nr:protein ECHIDNA-like protein [Corchorus olitorius]